MFTFLYPLYFLLLVPIIFFIILLYFKGGKKISIGDMEVFNNIFKGNSVFFKLKYILIFLIFIFYIFIFTNPVRQDILEKEKKNGIDIQIILDVSYSMIATDLAPNRLEVAKEVIEGFLEKIKTDRVGIVVFAGKTFTSIPLSFDYKIIQKTIAKISVETINQNNRSMQGTAVGDALLHSGESFLDKNREKVIILVTDGEANKGLDPMVSVEYLKEKVDKNIKIYTIGIGSKSPTSIFIQDRFGRDVEMKVAGVDEKTLKNISHSTNGKYFMASNKEALKNIFDEISKIEKTEIESETMKINILQYTYFLYSLIFFFTIFLILKFRKNL